MPTFRLNYGEVVEFEGQGASEVVSFIAMSHLMGSESEDIFLRRLASEMCEWSGDYYCFSSRDSLARSMMRSGLLEVID